MTHTPGPWEALRGVLKGDHILIRGGDYGIAKVYDEDDGMAGVNEANAQLIAEAPVLLDVLENLAIHVSMGWETDVLLAKATEAVKRARGEA